MNSEELDSVDIMEGHLRAINAKANGKLERVFDWLKVAYLIKEHQPTTVEAALREDYYATADDIWRDGKPFLNARPYLISLWATPIALLDGKQIECFIQKTESITWNGDTVWPDEALEVLGFTREQLIEKDETTEPSA